MTDFGAGGWTCPLPLRDFDRIVLGHGGGGQLTADLIEHLFLPAFGGRSDELNDAAVLPRPDGRCAFATDSFVVQPLRFPGGCIGDLAINGTVNDLAMSGAQPIALSAAFILEEGLALETLGDIVEQMAAAARRAGVRVLTGDTKVVGRGQADGMYITTAGIGEVREGVDIRPARAQPGDVVLLSGPIGQHGITVMSAREGLEFGTGLRSDSAPLNDLVATMLDTGCDIHVLRDPTRGGLAATLCEIAQQAAMGIRYEETLLPIPTEVAAACSFLGFDPTTIANEGCLVAIVAASDVDHVMSAMLDHPQGNSAVVIGSVTDEHPGTVVAQTALGGRRVVGLPLGEQLPRIC